MKEVLKTVRVDIAVEGKNKVSAYLKERKVLRYIKSNFSIDQYNLVQDQVMRAKPNYLNKMYDRVILNIEMTLSEVLSLKD